MDRRLAGPPVLLLWADDDCSAAEDAGYVRCRTIVTSRPVAGGGWLHEVTKDSPRESSVLSVAASAEQA